GPERRGPAQSGPASGPVDIAAGPAYLRPGQPMGARGGIGRRARFRSVFRKEWWFDSTRAHHSPLIRRWFGDMQPADALPTFTKPLIARARSLALASPCATDNRAWDKH